jgi:predicted NBD/HSP70 family sugar kinase
MLFNELIIACFSSTLYAMQKQTSKSLRDHNKKIVLSFLRKSGPTTIPEIAAKLRLSNNTVSKIVLEYTEAGLVHHDGKRESTEIGGKKPNLFVFNPKARYVVGIQISEGEIAGAITDLDVNLLDEISIQTPDNSPIEIVLENIIVAYNTLIESQRVDRDSIIGLAVGTHGITDCATGTIIISPRNPIWGRDTPLRKMVRERIPESIPIYVDNQIRFQAFAEKFTRMGKDTENMVVIRCGDGAIAGIILNNTIRRSNNFLFGHIGHMVLNPQDPEICKCGGRGCIETLISTKRVVRKAIEKYEEHPESRIFENKKSLEIVINDIFDASNKGDLLAQELLDEVIHWFSIGIHNLVLAYDPDTFVIQGEYAMAGNYFIDNIRKKFNQVSLFDIDIDCTIEYSQLGTKAGVIGAAAYVIEEYFLNQENLRFINSPSHKHSVPSTDT